MLIKCEKLEKSYYSKNTRSGLKGAILDLIEPRVEEVKSLVDITFSINSGEFVGVLGTNGSGKSTLIKIMTGLFRQTAGSIMVLDSLPSDQKRKFLLEIGTVFGHKSSLWWDLPLIESFKTQKAIYDIDEKVFHKNLDELVDQFKLKKLLNRPAKYFSLGERVKSEIVLNLLHNPKILFLDEPTVGLDVVSKHELRKALLSRVKNQKTTIVITTHDMVDVEECCDRVILLEKGKMIYDGEFEKLKNKVVKGKVLEIKAIKEPIPKNIVFDILSNLEKYTVAGAQPKVSKDKITIYVEIATSVKEIFEATSILSELDIQIRTPTLEEALRDYYVNETISI